MLLTNEFLQNLEEIKKPVNSVCLKGRGISGLYQMLGSFYFVRGLITSQEKCSWMHVEKCQMSFADAERILKVVNASYSLISL